MRHFAFFPHNFRNICQINKICLEYVPWLMRIFFTHFPPRKSDNLMPKMKRKNFLFLEDFVSVGKNYHSKNPQTYLNPNMYLLLCQRHLSARKSLSRTPYWSIFRERVNEESGGPSNCRGSVQIFAILRIKRLHHRHTLQLR